MVVLAGRPRKFKGAFTATEGETIEMLAESDSPSDGRAADEAPSVAMVHQLYFASLEMDCSLLSCRHWSIGGDGCMYVDGRLLGTNDRRGWASVFQNRCLLSVIRVRVAWFVVRAQRKKEVSLFDDS